MGNGIEAEAYFDEPKTAFPEPDPITTIPATIITRPVGVPALPLILSSPHSGRNYTPDFLARSHLPLEVLRSGEDFHVDTLIADAPRHGATTLCATFPRVICDVNRAQFDFDPAMIEDFEYLDALPSERGRAGLGSIPRIVSGGRPVYSDKLTYAEVSFRLQRFWNPYHAMLAYLIDEAKKAFGFCLVLDMHSMPPGVEGSKAEIVVGDRFGMSASPALVQSTMEILTGQSFRIARNHPFAGGYITSHYGAPAQGVHVIQLEINRALYMRPRSSQRLGLKPGFSERIEKVISEIAEVVRNQAERNNES